MKTKNILKAMAAAMLMPAMMLTTACSSDDDLANSTPDNIIKKGYEVPVTVSATRQGDADATGNRASFNETSKKLEFTAGDKLFVSGNNLTAGKFAGTLDYDAGTKKFSGTITTENTYTGTVDDLLAGSEADLLPKDYNPYGFLSIWDRGTEELYDDVFTWVDTKAFAKSKAEAVEQFSLEYGAYNSGTGFMLAPHKAVLNFTISGLAASTGVEVDFIGSGSVTGNVTTDASGTAKFAIGLSKNKDLNSCSLKVGGNAITLVSESKTVEAGKIYNIERSAVKTLAEATPEDVGKIAGKDGKIYATKAAAEAVATGNAVAMIAYVGEAGSADASSATYKGLALALEDVSGAKAWCSQTSAICLTNQKSSEPAAKGDMAGIANTDALCSHASHTHAAASAARDYSVTRPDGTSAWFLPSAGQWHKMATAAGGYANLKTNAGLQNYYYWTSSENDYYRAWKVEDDQDHWLMDHKDYENYVRACLAF